VKDGPRIATLTESRLGKHIYCPFPRPDITGEVGFLDLSFTRLSCRCIKFYLNSR